MARNQNQCKATTKAGSRCKKTNGIKNGFCLFHDPKRRKDLEAMSHRGGRNRIPKPTKTFPVPKTMEDVKKWAAEVAKQVYDGNLDPRRAREVTQALRQLTVALEKVDLQREVNAIKKQLKEAKKRGAIK